MSPVIKLGIRQQKKHERKGAHPIYGSIGWLSNALHSCTLGLIVIAIREESGQYYAHTYIRRHTHKNKNQKKGWKKVRKTKREGKEEK